MYPTLCLRYKYTTQRAWRKRTDGGEHPANVEDYITKLKLEHQRDAILYVPPAIGNLNAAYSVTPCIRYFTFWRLFCEPEISTNFRPEMLRGGSVSVQQNLNAAWDARTCPHRLFSAFHFCRVVNVMNALLTAVDCASAALMAAAAVFDGESEAATMNDIVFFLQLAALVGKERSRQEYYRTP